MNLMYLKVLGGVGAGAAGITGAYFAIEGSKNPPTSALEKLGEGISKGPISTKEELTRRIEENQNNNEKTGTNSKKFIDDHELSQKQAKDILGLIKEKLDYEITSVPEDSLRQNLESYVFGAIESFCTGGGENNSDEIFKKYCK